MERVYNFAAGPATIDPSVLEKAQKELVCYQDKGMSVMEMSHRSAMYLDIYNETEALLRQLMGIPENYKVLFLQGGATLQFSAVPLNLMGEKNTADYADTGNFAHLAAEEAKKCANVRVRGLMCIPPVAEGEHGSLPYFEKVHALFVDINAKLYDNTLDILSMGMSGDYEDAVRAGATMVRVGTAIFGARNYTI